MWSFLTDRTQQVAYNGRLSPIFCLSSVWRSTGFRPGPLLSVVYTAELSGVVELYKLHLHQYTEDSQIHVSSLIEQV